MFFRHHHFVSISIFPTKCPYQPQYWKILFVTLGTPETDAWGRPTRTESSIDLWRALFCSYWRQWIWCTRKYSVTQSDQANTSSLDTSVYAIVHWFFLYYVWSHATRISKGTLCCAILLYVCTPYSITQIYLLGKNCKKTHQILLKRRLQLGSVYFRAVMF